MHMPLVPDMYKRLERLQEAEQLCPSNDARDRMNQILLGALLCYITDETLEVCLATAMMEPRPGMALVRGGQA